MSNDDLTQKIKRASQEAFRRCGLSEQLFNKFFIEEITRMNLDIHDAEVLNLAEQEGYCSGTDSDCEESDYEGWCKHGFPIDCCPLGCGEG